MTNGLIRPHTVSKSMAHLDAGRALASSRFIARDAPISRAHETCYARKAGRHVSGFGPSVSAHVSAMAAPGLDDQENH